MSYLAEGVHCEAPCGGQAELVMDAGGLKGLLLSVRRLTLGQRAELLAALDAGGHHYCPVKWATARKFASIGAA